MPAKMVGRGLNDVSTARLLPRDCWDDADNLAGEFLTPPERGESVLAEWLKMRDRKGMQHAESGEHERAVDSGGVG